MPAAAFVSSRPWVGAWRRLWTGAWWSLAAAAVWALLAVVNPTTTYHLAPLVVTLAWPVAARTTGAPGRRARAALTGLVAGAALSVLAASHALRGPAPVGPTATVEALMLIAAGALMALALRGRRQVGASFDTGHGRRG